MSKNKDFKQTRFEISADELQHRMDEKNRLRDEPLTRAVALLESALDTVITSLGVNVNTDPQTLHMEMDLMGIMVVELDEPSQPSANGYYVILRKTGRDGKLDYIPYAWVGGASVNSEGRCMVDIQWFRDERLTEIAGDRLPEG